MRKLVSARLLLPLTCLLSLMLVAGIALADDPDGDIQTARDLLAQADALLAQEQAKPPVVQTVTATVTQTVTETVTAPPPTTTTTAPPSPTTTTTAPPPPPAAGFPSRAEALARANVVVKSGTFTTAYKPAVATDTTYDLRGFTSTAYPPGYPVVIDGTRNVVIGGRVFGQQPRTDTWAQVHDGIGGGGLNMHITDYGVSYDFRVDNVTDGIRPFPPADLSGKFLIEGAYMTWIRDDAIEDDDEMSGTIRDVLVDGANNALSIGQSVKNPNAVVNVENAIFILMPMRNDRAADGVGHQTLFKQAPGGRVNLTNVTVCMYENPITPSRIGIRPPGTWTNVVFVLGPGWVGPDPAVPSGATVSRDWQGLCVNAANAWRAAHGF